MAFAAAEASPRASSAIRAPLDETGENADGEVWFYRYSENPKDPNDEPELGYIEDDEEYEAVADAFDEFLDAAEFDEIVD